MSKLIRVGHKGADAIVAGNTLASFDAAAAAGVDMIEFDVLAERPDGSGELLVIHDHGALRGAGSAPTLSQALTHLAGGQFASISLQLDVKRPGYERRLVAVLAAAGLVGRSFISTGFWSSLELIRSIEPALRLGWTVPDPLGLSSTPGIAQTFGHVQRSRLAALAAARIRAGAIEALVPQWRLVTPALVRAVTEAGGEIYAWTVDDLAAIRHLAAIGTTGVITNDPRLFALVS